MKQYKYKVKGVDYEVTIHDVEGKVANVEVNGVPFEVELEGEIKAAPPKIAKIAPVPKPAATPTATPVASVAPAAVTGAGKPIKSPLPGVIVSINVSVGQAVKKTDTVLVLEAMKMENNILAELDGTVTAIAVNKGDSVMEGAVLFTIG